MKLLWLAALLTTSFWSGFTGVAVRNRWKAQAFASFQKGEYQNASRFYQQLLSGKEKDKAEIQLNLAHSLRLSGKLAPSISVYQQVTKSGNPALRSVAWQQLGNLAAKAKEYQKALHYFRSSLIENSHNETARYNYELIARLMEQDKQQDQSTPQAPQPENQKQDQAEPSNKGSQENPEQNKAPGESGQEREEKQGSESGNEKGQKGAEGSDSELQQNPKSGQENDDQDTRNLNTLKQRLENINMTPEQAQTILNAMRDNELQYLQQLPKPAKNTSKKGVPNW